MTAENLPDRLPAVAERERVVEVLSSHFAAGNLQLDDFERRIAAAYAETSLARVDALLADLPRTNASVAAANVPDRGKIVSMMSNNERSGPMVIPRHLEIVSVLGNVELDMRGATFGSGITEIHVKAFLGNVELILPANVRVDTAGSTFLGNFESRSDPAIDPSVTTDVVVRVSGRAVLASVEATQGPLSFDSPMVRERLR